MKNYKFIISVISFYLLFFCSQYLNAGNVKDLIPTQDELNPFFISEDPECYYPGNLYDYINGAAPAYISYGFKEMVNFYVINKNDSSEIIIDIYDMGDSLNAFGIYSSERYPDYDKAEVGSDGFLTGSSLFFWQDKYYVKVFSYDFLPETEGYLNKLANLLSAKIPKRGSLPNLFSIFPENNKIQSSEQFIKNDVLGRKYFTNGYKIEYQEGDKKYRIFLIQNLTIKDAKQNFITYMTGSNINNELLEDEQVLGDQAFIGQDSFYGNTLFARKNTFIVGILGLENLEKAKNIISVMFSDIEKNIGLRIY